MPIETAKAPAEVPENVFYLDIGVLGGREIKPGDKLTLQVAEIGDNEVGVFYPEEEVVAEENPDALGLEAFGEY